jgi:hypothetical protein
MPPDRLSPTFAALADPTSYLQVGDSTRRARASCSGAFGLLVEYAETP